MIPAFKWSHDDKFFARMSKVIIKRSFNSFTFITYSGRENIIYFLRIKASSTREELEVFHIKYLKKIIDELDLYYQCTVRTLTDNK